MTEHVPQIPPIEPERYELDEQPPYRFAVDRRQFMQVLGGGVAVLLALERAPAQESGGGRAGGAGRGLPEEIGAWLHIGGDGVTTVYTGKVEFGQNIRTSLAQAVADELGVPIESIRLVMGDTDLTPYDSGTFGSRSTPVMATQLRRVAASARQLLVGLAAEHWDVDRGTLSISGGRVEHRDTSRGVGIGALVRGRTLTETISESSPATPAHQWRVAGQSAPKVDGRAFVTGAHRYTSDLVLPGMLYGKVRRPPAFGATLKSVDLGPAESMADTVVVRDGDFIGAAAPSELAASRAIWAIRAQWASAPQPSAAELFTDLKDHAEGQGAGAEEPWRGRIRDGLAAADHQIDRRYTVAYIAHAPMEPRAAVAHWVDGRLTVWTGTQRPFGVRSELAEAFRLAEGRVRVIVPDTGSGYGGKHTGEVAIEAARLARAAGRPVKLVWTRSEEFTWAYFRPAGVIEIRSGITDQGALTAWELHNYNSGGSGIRGVYDVPHEHVEFHRTRSPLRQGSYRGLAATANHFARETHMDELAHAAGFDPLELRLLNLRDARMTAVLEAAAGKFGWGAGHRPKGRGVGLAAGFEKGGYVATCAEVSLDGLHRQIRIERVVTAFECGAIVNPDDLTNQIEGSIVMGIGGAVFEAIDFADGKITNNLFAKYRVPRFGDLPLLETVLVDRPDLPSAGAGETPIVGLAPAVGNAIFDLTGIRLRSLPLAPGGLDA